MLIKGETLPQRNKTKKTHLRITQVKNTINKTTTTKRD